VFEHAVYPNNHVCEMEDMRYSSNVEMQKLRQEGNYDNNIHKSTSNYNRSSILTQ